MQSSNLTFSKKSGDLGTSDDKEENGDQEAIALLREIFPDASRKEIFEIHQSNIQGQGSTKCEKEGDGRRCNQYQTKDYLLTMPLALTSALGRRVLRHYQEQKENQPEKKIGIGTIDGRHPQLIYNLPDDFLRIPDSAAICVKNASTSQDQSKLVSEMEQSVISQHAHKFSPDDTHNGQRKGVTPCGVNMTIVFSRDRIVGLGMTILELKGSIYVHSLLCHDGTRISDIKNLVEFRKNHRLGTNDFDGMGPAFRAGIRPGDCLLGLNRLPFLRDRYEAGLQDERKKNILQRASDMIKSTPDPIVLHIWRPLGREKVGDLIRKECTAHETSLGLLNSKPGITIGGEPSILGRKTDNCVSLKEEGTDLVGVVAATNARTDLKHGSQMHPLAVVLIKRDIIQKKSGKLRVSSICDAFWFLYILRDVANSIIVMF